MSRREYRTVSYRDELLADRSVRRAYTDGRQEWRQRAGEVVRWRDNTGATGFDEPVGDRIVKRTTDRGPVRYGRELGFGRTAWSDGVLTVNETSMGGRAGAIMAGIGAAGLLPAIVDPPDVLTPEEEAELRQQAAAQQQSSGGGDSDSGGSDSDWTDPGDGGDDDFG
jgi:hypothetical protein